MKLFQVLRFSCRRREQDLNVPTTPIPPFFWPCRCAAGKKGAFLHTDILLNLMLVTLPVILYHSCFREPLELHRIRQWKLKVIVGPAGLPSTVRTSLLFMEICITFVEPGHWQFYSAWLNSGRMWPCWAWMGLWNLRIFKYDLGSLELFWTTFIFRPRLTWIVLPIFGTGNLKHCKYFCVKFGRADLEATTGLASPICYWACYFWRQESRNKK